MKEHGLDKKSLFRYRCEIAALLEVHSQNKKKLFIQYNEATNNNNCSVYFNGLV